MSEVRRRQSNDAPSSGEPRDRDLAQFIGKENVEKISHLFDAVRPLFHVLGQFMNVVWPYLSLLVSKLQAFWLFLQPYHPWELSSALVGLFTAFFGARFLLLLGAIEAARQTGYEKFSLHLRTIYSAWLQVQKENAADNARDDDQNGRADVSEISRSDLFTRKFKLLLRTIDPDSVGGALSSLWILFLGCVASLRLQYAQTVTLALGMSEAMERVIVPHVLPVIERGLHPEYRKWSPVIVKHTLRSLCVWGVLLVTRLQATLYTASRGAHLFAAGALQYAASHNVVHQKWTNDSSPLQIAIVVIITVTGCYFQLNTFFALPFPLNILLWPANLVENTLLYFVANGVQTGPTSAPIAA